MMMKCNRCESSYHLTCLDKAKTQRISKTSIVCAKHCPEGREDHVYMYMHVNILDPHCVTNTL